MEDLPTTLLRLSALSQETRLLAFRCLMTEGKAGMRAGVLADKLEVAANSLSMHLNILTQSGLVTVRRDGRYKIYCANIEAINGLLTSLVETCCNGHPEVCGIMESLSVPKDK